MDFLIRIVSSVARTVGVLVGWLEVQRNRRRIYSSAVLLLPVLTGASLLTDGQAQKVLAALAILAGGGVPALAKRHTPKRQPAWRLEASDPGAAQVHAEIGAEIEKALRHHARRQGREYQLAKHRRRGQAGNADLLVLLAIANLIGVVLLLFGVHFR